MKLLAMLLVAGTCFAQTPPAGSGDQGSIEGRVVHAVSGHPVRRATLSLTLSKGKNEPVSVQSDDQGSFAFRNLQPGEYQLNAERNGYHKQNYSTKLQPNAGVPIKIAAGQSLRDLIFRLSPVSILAGRVTDDAGEPMPNLLVTVMRSTYVRGKRQWTSAGSAQTNDRGEYRVSNLRAGRYLVSVNDLNIGIGLAGVSNSALPEQPEPGNASTWFGNTIDVMQASSVELGTGEDRRGTDIRMIRTKTVRVRGHVLGAPDGKQTLVMLLPKVESEMRSVPRGLGIVQQKDGAFEIKNVVAGSYLLMARSATEMQSSSSGAVQIEVADRHLDGVELKLGEAAEVTGVVSGMSGKPDDWKDFAVRLEMVDFSLPETPSAKPNPDGTFTLQGVSPGRYRVQFSGLPEDAFLRARRVRGADIPAIGAQLQGGEKLEVVVSRTAATIEGKVMGADDKPVAGATVVLIPSDANERLYEVAVTGLDGSYRLVRITPGKYNVLAWEEIEPGAWMDQEFVKPLLSKVEAVTLEENTRLKLPVTAIPAQKEQGRSR